MENVHFLFIQKLVSMYKIIIRASEHYLIVSQAVRITYWLLIQTRRKVVCLIVVNENLSLKISVFLKL